MAALVVVATEGAAQTDTLGVAGNIGVKVEVIVNGDTLGSGLHLVERGARVKYRIEEIDGADDARVILRKPGEASGKEVPKSGDFVITGSARLVVQKRFSPTRAREIERLIQLYRDYLHAADPAEIHKAIIEERQKLFQEYGRDKAAILLKSAKHFAYEGMSPESILEAEARQFKKLQDAGIVVRQ